LSKLVPAEVGYVPLMQYNLLSVHTQKGRKFGVINMTGFLNLEIFLVFFYSLSQDTWKAMFW